MHCNVLDWSVLHCFTHRQCHCIEGAEQACSAIAGHCSRQTTGQEDFKDGNVDNYAAKRRLPYDIWSICSPVSGIVCLFVCYMTIVVTGEFDDHRVDFGDHGRDE